MKKLSLFVLCCCTSFVAHAQTKSPVDSLKYLNDLGCNTVFWKIIARQKESIPLLIEKLDDTTMTAVKDKCKKNNLRVGDLAYLALEEIIPLPFFAVTGVQCDVIKDGCVVGVFEYIESNRKKFKAQVYAWNRLESKNFIWRRYDSNHLTPCRFGNGIEGKYSLR